MKNIAFFISAISMVFGSLASVLATESSFSLADHVLSFSSVEYVEVGKFKDSIAVAARIKNESGHDGIQFIAVEKDLKTALISLVFRAYQETRHSPSSDPNYNNELKTLLKMPRQVVGLSDAELNKFEKKLLVLPKNKSLYFNFLGKEIVVTDGLLGTGTTKLAEEHTFSQAFKSALNYISIKEINAILPNVTTSTKTERPEEISIPHIVGHDPVHTSVIQYVK